MSPIILLAGVLAGCSAPEEVWLIQVPYVSEPECTQQITHNFRNAYIPDTPPGDWTETELSEQSDALYFAQLSITDAENAVLVLAGEVWPGISSGDGEWEFTWTGFEDNRLAREHDEGYRYTEQAYLEVAETITMTIDGGSAEGSWAVETTDDYTYTETDEWDFEVGLTVGEIPSSSYLAYDDDDVEGIPQTNVIDESDCSDSTCQLRVIDTCVEDLDFEATRTSYDTEESYDQLEGSTQPHGT